MKTCIMAWLFTEYDVARNSQVLHWNFSIPRDTSKSTKISWAGSTITNTLYSACEEMY